MTKADDAYKEAERRIAKALAEGAIELDLKIEDLETIPPEIADLKSLTHLFLSNTRISDATPLAALTSLTLLDLRNTQISDVTPLAALTSLTHLYLSNTQISDLRPIENLESLVRNQGFSGLFFHNTPATELDPELKRLSEIEGTKDRTRQTLDYLKSLKEWPPSEAMPEDKPLAAKYVVPDNGPIQAAGDPIGPNDPEQQALQEECREKIRTLITSVREGDNELAALLDHAAKYRDLIDKEPTHILASSLWSAANTLRARHEAHQSADAQARINDMLPPQTASALQDLLETHGIFFLGHPGAAEVERKRREFLSGPRNPDARDTAEKIAESLIDNSKVIAKDASGPIAMDNEAAAGEGPSAQMAEASFFDRLQNIAGSIARKVWNFSKTKAGVSIDAIIGAEVASWWIANKSLFVSFYQYLQTNIPAWLNWLIGLL